MKQTPNLLLKLPEPTDYVLVEDLNENFTKLDTEIAKISDPTTGLEAKLTKHLDDYTGHVPYTVDSGTANAKVVALSSNPTSYIDGMAIAFKNAVLNTGAVTINVNGLGAKSIVKSNGNPLTSGNLKANSIYTVRYNGSNFILQGEGGSGNASASDLLSGKTASTDAGDIVGTMPNRGTFNLGLGVPVPAGYYSDGTTANGKKWLSGTKSTDSNGMIEVNNLDFKPSLIIIKFSGATDFFGFPYVIYDSNISTTNFLKVILSSDSRKVLISQNGGYLNNQGFKFHLEGGIASYNWTAIE